MLPERHSLGSLRRGGAWRLEISGVGGPLQRLQWHTGRRRVLLPLDRSQALSRRALDAALAATAIARGAVFLSETTVHWQFSIQDKVVLRLRNLAGRATIRAEIVVGATGLGGGPHPFPAGTPEVRPGSRVGAGALFTRSSTFYQPGTIYMASGDGGYVGLVRLEDDRLNLAAALDPVATRAARGLVAPIQKLLTVCGLPPPDDLAHARWHGTPPLTRSASRFAGHRWLLVGDAAGFVEPFTGEGMAWAMYGAVLATPLVVRAVRHGWSEEIAEDWAFTYRRRVEAGQSWCRWISAVVRRPWLSQVMAAALSRVPGLARPVLRRLAGPATAGGTLTGGRLWE